MDDGYEGVGGKDKTREAMEVFVSKEVGTEEGCWGGVNMIFELDGKGTGGSLGGEVVGVLDDIGEEISDVVSRSQCDGWQRGIRVKGWAIFEK